MAWQYLQVPPQVASLACEVRQQQSEVQHSRQQASQLRGSAAAAHQAEHPELQHLTEALRQAEQRASAAEVAIATVQRAHTEAVEQSTRLQASPGSSHRRVVVS